MATFTNINCGENINNLITKLGKLEDSKTDSYVFRKHINYSISNSFIHKEIPVLSSFVAPLKQNLKSQVEELQKLQSEIISVEEKIRELDISKKTKLTKIEDLRRIIQRIADEESFDCVFTTRSNSRITPREKMPASLSSRKKLSSETNLPATTTTTTVVPVETTEEAAAEEGEGAKQGINQGCGCKSYYLCGYHSGSCHMRRGDDLQNCLLFWQEHLAAPKKIFKA